MTMQSAIIKQRYRIPRKPREKISPLKEDNSMKHLKKVWHPRRVSYVMVDEKTGDVHDITKPPKNMLDNILEDYWDCVSEFLDPKSCHKVESGTQFAYLPPLGCRLNWVSEMRFH